uniref:Uncharacterized protein n=2 Tax=Acrobeloides nanus TaxID=290746 RepID=A0A914DJX8_9BILA
MYVWPTIEDAYYRQQSDIYRNMPNPANIAIDGNYDSPGFSAELCAVAAIEESTHQVIDFSVVHKSEVENVSNRMELEGVKKLLPAVESNVRIGNITLDKHPQVVSFLKNHNYDYGFDPWHRLKGIKKELKKLIRSLEDEEKNNMKELARRFIVHVYKAIEFSNGDVNLCKELVFAFFLHVQGIHEWPSRKFAELIPVAPNTDVCKRFQDEKFSLILQCPHVANPNIPDSRHELTRPNSKPYQMLLALVAKTTFMNDLDKMRHGNNTSFVESFWSKCIRYRPKMLYFPKIGFLRRTMLAAIDFNEMRQAELRGDRRISEIYECFSKSKGEKVTKVKKSPISDEWKINIVKEVIERKRIQGPGDPVHDGHDGQEESDEELDLVCDRLDDLLYFSDSETDDVEF